MKGYPLRLSYKLLILMATCSFQELVGSACGVSKFNSHNLKCISIGSCVKDIKGHLKTWKTNDSFILSEAELLLARAGIFDKNEDHLKMSMCPRHRDDFGVRWKCNKRFCCCPPEWAPHKDYQRKADRGITLTQSKILHANTTVLVPVGSPICKRCRLFLGSLKSETGSNMSLTKEPDDSLDGAASCAIETEVLTEDEASFMSLCDKLENLTVTSTCVVSQYTSETDGSSTSSEPSNPLDITTRRKLLNEFLSANGKEEIASLKKPWDHLNNRSKGFHASKAGNAVAAVLEVTVPENVHALWDTMKNSKSVERAIGHDGSSSADKVYLQSLAEAYQNSVSWDTRRQILSIMADLVPYSTIKEYIPGASTNKIKAARRHKLEYGRGAVLSPLKCPRMRVNALQLDHFLCFITSAQVVQDLPFGKRHLELSSGKILEIPNIIRTMIPQRIMKQYEQYCKESRFTPFSKSTMQRIMLSCTASTRKSLQGLDYFAADGAKGFDNLVSLTDKLVETSNLERQEGQRIQNDLKEGKLYLKDDYKVHVSMSSNVPDHCISLSLNDPKDKCFTTACEHEHDNRCQCCDQLKRVINEIESALSAANFQDEDHDDHKFSFKQAVQAINAWKAHQLRSIQQDKARINVLDKLDQASVLITSDWAMKFLPLKYRESQTDWFGGGICWHISVVVRNVNSKIQHQTLVHIVENTNQDSDTVVKLMKHTLTQLKEQYPEITTAYLRQDNAACYHSAPLLAGCRLLKETGIKIAQVDFSDPQGGKGPCDRKAATIKAHVRHFVNEGNDVVSASDFKDAILSFGGINGVRVCLVEMMSSQALTPAKWKGISTFNNFSSEANSCTVWRAYDVGSGNSVKWSELQGEHVVKVVDHIK